MCCCSGMGATGSRSTLGQGLPGAAAGLPCPSAGGGPTAGGTPLPRQPGTPKGAKDDMLDETFIDVSYFLAPAPTSASNF